MAPNKICSLVVASTILVTAGCSGAKLRNLISRNDYQSLEELEASDSTYDKQAEEAIAGTNADRSRLVSDSDELEEDDDGRDRRFSITRLLRGKPSATETEFGEDPFVEPISTVVEKTNSGPAVKAVSGVKTDDFQAAAHAADKFSSSLDEVEKQAERMFADVNDAGQIAGQSAFAEAMTKAEASNDASADTSQSFADFTARNSARRSGNPESSPDRTLVSQIAESEFAEVPASHSDGGFDFDTLLDRPVADVVDFEIEEEAPGPAADPFLDQMFASASDATDSGFDFEQPVVDKSFDEVFVGPRTSSSTEESAAEEDPFSLASQKHGFKPLGTKDPWAAFDSTKTTREVAWGDNSNTVAQPESDFAWGQSKSGDFDDVLGFDALAADRGVFKQVASTSVVEEKSPGQQAPVPQGLVIPFSAPPTSHGSDFSEMGSSEDLMDDPFFSAAGDELSEVPVDVEIDRAILAILLFLPNRQKQHN